MKHIFLLLMGSLIVMNVIAQYPGNQSSNLLPARNSIVRAGSSASLQAKNWESERNNQPANAAAWLNNYIWTERDDQLGSKEKKERLGAILTGAEKHISQSAEYWLMIFLRSGKKDSAAVYNALSLAKDKSLVYPYLIQFSITRGNHPDLEKFCTELNSSAPLAESLYEYHYNVLASADSNAIIYARGLNDLVSMAIMQQVHHIREDIRLKFYDGQTIERKTPVYLCLSLGKDVLAKYPASFCTGLLVKTSGKQDPGELEEHFERFELGFLQGDELLPDDVVQLYRNYLPGFLLLYKYYLATNNDRAGEVKELIYKIAGQSGTTSEVNKLLGK